jgi:nucleotide-binding universal stress UspA family protein
MKSLLLVVSSDDEARTRALVARALRLLVIHPARVHLANVQPRVTGHVAMFFGLHELERLQHDAGREALRPAQALLDAAGVRYNAHVLVGHSAECIAELAQIVRCQRILCAEPRGVYKAFGSLAEQMRHLLMGRVECEVVAGA